MYYTVTQSPKDWEIKKPIYLYYFTFSNTSTFPYSLVYSQWLNLPSISVWLCKPGCYMLLFFLSSLYHVCIVVPSSWSRGTEVQSRVWHRLGCPVLLACTIPHSTTVLCLWQLWSKCLCFFINLLCSHWRIRTGYEDWHSGSLLNALEWCTVSCKPSKPLISPSCFWSKEFNTPSER